MKGLALLLATASIAAPGHPTHATHPQHRCSIVHKVWSPKRWHRGQPKASAIAAFRDCPNWKSAKKHYYRHRSKMRWLVKYKPFVYPDGSRWAVPWPIAVCESGGNYYVGPSGAYGLIPPLPQWLPPKRQDEIAHDLYVRYGEGPWRPYESGCYLR